MAEPGGEHRPDIRRAISGDRRATEDAARYAGQLAMKTASALLRSRDDASDVAQDVVVDVIRQIDHLRDPEKFEAWVHKITRRKTMRALRVRRRRWQTESQEELETVGVEAPQGAVTSRVALQTAMRLALRRLPEKQRTAFVLRYVHDLTDVQIGEVMECPANTAASHLHRARAALRDDTDLRAYWSGEQGEHE